MRNMDIADSRTKLEQYAAQGRMAAVGGLIGELSPGGADVIVDTVGEEDSASTTAADVLDHAAIDSGTD
jgi:argininosuccinate synthase